MKDVSKVVSLKKEGRTHMWVSVCAGGRGAYKFMWVSEGEVVYVRGREGVLHDIGRVAMCKERREYAQVNEEGVHLQVNEGEEDVHVWLKGGGGECTCMSE